MSPVAPRWPGRLWPDERQALLLQAALADAAGARTAWDRLAGGLDPARLDRGSERLLPLVWANLRRHGIADERLEPCYHATRRDNERRLAELGAVLETLDRAGVATIVLKGAALVTGAYADPGLRPMSDVDVLVPPAAVDRAVRALEAAGWVADAPVSAVMRRLTHAVAFRHPARAPVDLHWHLLEECCRPDDDAPLWAAAVPASIGGAPTRVPAPEDQLLHVCVHAEKWVHVPGIRWVADAVTLVRRGGIAWERLVAEAARRRVVLRMRAQLRYLRAAFAAPVPPEALAQLAAAPVSRLERLEQRWGVRDRRRPWLLVYWCNHRRAAGGGPVHAALTFPRYLQATWRLDSLAGIPGAALARVARATRRGAHGS